MLIKQICPKNMIFVTNGILKILVLNMSLIFAMVVFFFFFCNGCHDLMQKAFYVKGSACRINFWYMSKDDAINIMNGSNLVDKMGVL